jgi:acyl-CoA synthetase (NDP forming)
MTTDIHLEKIAPRQAGSATPALLAMLEARSVAIVGASARPASFGARMVAEAGKSPARPAVYPVNPRYSEIDGRRCYASLADLPEPIDLALLGVPDASLEQQLALAAETGCRSAVIFGNAVEASPGPDEAGPPLRQRLAAIANSAGMELCGAGCMGFVNVGHGLRAVGYVEPDPLPAGPVALVTHSGSVFSTLLRTKRAFGFTVAVSSGQELVTAAPSYLEYALSQPETKVLALVLEAIREPVKLRQVLAHAAERDLPVVLLTAGNSASGRAMVAAHSGALAGSGAGWEALTRSYGLHRVTDFAELADTLELFTLLTRRRPPPGNGIATVHDSGLERAHAADVADELGVPFAPLAESTKARLTELLDAGLNATNPLDVWGTGASTRELFSHCLTALADDESVQAVALAVDLVTEFDGDDAYQLAVLDAAARTSKPIAVIANLPSAIDTSTAALLRGNGIPVLEGMRTGLAAMRHLLDRLDPQPARGPAKAPADPARRARVSALLARCGESGAIQLALLAEYGIAAARTERVSSADEALAAAARIGYPVVLKTDEPAIAHKSDAGGVLLGVTDEAALLAGYRDLASRLGPAALVCQTVPAGVELALGIVTDPDLGPLIVVGAGGLLVELIADRAVALPELAGEQPSGLLAGLKVATLLAGHRGAAPANLGAIAKAIAGVAELASDLGDRIEALDINPLICSPAGAVAVDALIIPR